MDNVSPEQTFWWKTNVISEHLLMNSISIFQAENSCLECFLAEFAALTSITSPPADMYVWMDVEEWWTNIQKSPEQVGTFLTQISFSVFVLNFVLIITKCYCFHTIPLSLFGLLFPISHFVATVFYFFYYQAVFKLSSLHLPLLHFHTLSIFVILPSLPSFISLCLSAFEDRLADRCV